MKKLLLVCLLITGCKTGIVSPVGQSDMAIACEDYGGVESYYRSNSLGLVTYCYDGSIFYVEYK